MRVVAPAKINLHLRVGGIRADGFHPLLSWMCTVDLFDTLTLIRGRKQSAERAAAGIDDWLSLSTDHPTLPIDRRNLVVAVATALADTLSRVGEGPVARRDRVSAYLKKRIPAGAGLGGGSSDAAAALMALAQMWKIDWPLQRLSDFSAQFGSDVPFFFHGPSSICTGRGEIVRPAPAPARANYAVLVLSDIEMPTPKVYAAFDGLGLGSDGNDAIVHEPPWPAWSQLPADELLAKLTNDLERPAFSLVPQLEAFRRMLEKTWNGKIVRMSGSGSSLFTLVDNEAQANDLASRARAANDQAAMGLKFEVRVVRLAPATHISGAETRDNI